MIRNINISDENSDIFLSHLQSCVCVILKLFSREEELHNNHLIKHSERGMLFGAEYKLLTPTNNIFLKNHKNSWQFWEGINITIIFLIAQKIYLCKYLKLNPHTTTTTTTKKSFNLKNQSIYKCTICIWYEYE